MTFGQDWPDAEADPADMPGPAGRGTSISGEKWPKIRRRELLRDNGRRLARPRWGFECKSSSSIIENLPCIVCTVSNWDSGELMPRGNSRGGGVRWVDVSGAEWRLKREGSGGRLLSLHGATHGGVKHGETARMIDGILRGAGMAWVSVPHHLLPETSTRRDHDGSSPLYGHGERLPPPGGENTRGGPRAGCAMLSEMALRSAAPVLPSNRESANTVDKKVALARESG
ncbi:hypothetical protein KM043_009605 [Ampulex compressa]|nr:hypothetical protein KM043_009605 [Ampulex compressa]